MSRLALALAGTGGLLSVVHKTTKVHALDGKPDAKGPKVAIIGAGIGGTSCAYFLRKHFGKAIELDVYEENKIGGRAAVVPIDKYGDYEAGASVIHAKNKYLCVFTKLFDIDRRKIEGKSFGLSNGENLYFVGNPDSWIPESVQMLWRYGLDVFRALFLVKFLLTKFDKIYELQDEGYAFTDVEDLLHAMSSNFVNMTKQSFKAKLIEENFQSKFIDEIATAAVHNNYGQDPSKIHAFVGCVSLAGIESNLWAVKGGNRLIPMKLLEVSGAHLIQNHVKEVKLLPTGLYEVISGKKESKTYDIVIIAAPQHERSTLNITGFGKRVIDLKSPYERIVTTFVRGTVNTEHFQKSPPFETSPFPLDITVTNTSNIFNTLAMNYNVNSDEKVSDNPVTGTWKLFAKEPLKDDLLKSIFSKIDSHIYVDWLAYPHYDTRHYLPSFKVHKNLYYINAIERAASCMEMSAIGARNVALLVINNWCNREEKIDDPLKIHKGNHGRAMF